MKRLIPAIIWAYILLISCPKIEAQSGQTASPQFNHTTIYVVDLKKSGDFYEQVMELQKISEPFHDNKHVWFKMGDHNQLHVVQGASAVMAHDINIHLAFSVPSLDDFMAHLEKMNVKYGNWKGDSKTPQMRPDQVRQIYFQDPEGYWIEVNEDKF
jgi:lactoylglutathione lyase